MLGPPAQISKIMMGLLALVVLFFLFMDYNLHIRIHKYPIDRGINDNNNFSYNDVSWLGYNISPLGDVTVKAVLLDHTNYYLFAPLVTILDNLLNISEFPYITPNAISFFHVFVAIASGKCIASDSLSYRRIGVVLFEIRTFLDDLDGHVARARKHIKGERSEVGTSGYFIDGICDGLGCIALLIGAFFYLKNNPPRGGYVQLPTVIDSKDSNVIMYKGKVTWQKSALVISCFALQLLISSLSWNRYIDLYQDMLENNSVSEEEFVKQIMVFKSPMFFIIAFFWRLVNVHNMIHLFLLAIFCDKMWEFLKFIQYIGYGILFSIICITEKHALDARNFIFNQKYLENNNNL
ncbi:ceramide phosphoethanolamine synthase [Coccinella septempunctata]|uniref:ceramide phosphoethanolamine synthase n=1 Tax=Coccinella septempunctata TaxID=41139 RepID=UPI001D07D3E1|nr:ceramide phosphoethanolamine synthase [Coccinella septempunctata]XP_044766863.1 ceramide phosphoethanolamine synthase [Coccinella septempunctata]XP_044766864.1 ceramide phosphoethanolamine synthase [Coccinella septempunctata]